MAVRPESLEDLRRRLTTLQRQALDQIWNHYVSTGQAYPSRSLHRHLGRQAPLTELFTGLNGSLVFETFEQGRAYRVSALGALATTSGDAIFQLITRFLDLVRTIWGEDESVDGISSASVQGNLGLSAAEAMTLFRVLTSPLPSQTPVQIATWNVNGEWSATFTDHVVALYHAAKTESYAAQMSYRPMIRESR